MDTTGSDDTTPVLFLPPGPTEGLHRPPPEPTSELDDPLSRIEELAYTFPSLRGAPGALPWDPVALDRWASGLLRHTQGRHSARFVLSVWDRHRAWRIGRFRSMQSLDVWDPEHTLAFRRWIRDRWRANPGPRAMNAG